jgi:hypothetical protein
MRTCRLLASPRARFYREIISEHCFNKFLDFVNVTKHRIALTRLICSSHRLPVETGRWERPVIPAEHRLCNVCNVLGDEFHLLLECSLYTDIRKQLIPRFYWARPSMFKCVLLLQSQNKKLIRNVAKYVYNCLIIAA